MSKTWSRRLSYWGAFFRGELVHPLQYPKCGLSQSFSNARMINILNPFMDAGGRIDAQDTSCAPVTMSWLVDTWFPWWIDYMERFDLRYSRQWDCDDYALTMWAMARMAFAKDPGTADTIALGYLKAHGHAINFAVTSDEKIVYIDPQNPKIVSRPNGIYWIQF